MGDDVFWETLYQKVADLAAKVGVAPSVPRNAGRHRNQPNAWGVTLSQFWLVNIYFPFLDHLVTEIEDCLLQANPRYNTQRLIPTQVAQTNPTEAQCRDIYLYIGVLISKLLEDEDTFLHECVLWRTWWTDQTMAAQCKTTPDNLEDALKLTGEALYPNIRKCLSLLMVVQVSTVTAERLFSTMRRVKAFL